MNRLKRILLSESEEVREPVPGEAPVAMSSQQVVTEPAPSAETVSGTDIYSLYPELRNVDITSPCELADFFASACEDERVEAEQELRSDLVGSQNNAAEEFA